MLVIIEDLLLRVLALFDVDDANLQLRFDEDLSATEIKADQLAIKVRVKLPTRFFLDCNLISGEIQSTRPINRWILLINW